jgi:hypothetical protein
MLRRFLFSISLLIFICSGLSLAQTNDYVEREAKRLDQKLGLTPEQVERVKEILKANLAEIDQLREENRGDRDAIRTAEKDIENTMRGQIQAMLTTDQQDKFAAIKATILLPRPGQDERIKEMNERLKLTNEQSATIGDIMITSQVKMDSLREQYGDNWQAMRPAMQKIREDTDRQIEALLTPGQVKEYEKMKEERSKEMRGPRPGMGGNRHRF